MNERRAPSLGGLGHTLHALWVCGLVSVLVDMDHLIRPIQLLLDGQTPTWSDIAGRPLHSAVFLVCWTICGVGFACGIRRLVDRIDPRRITRSIV